MKRRDVLKLVAASVVAKPAVVLAAPGRHQGGCRGHRRRRRRLQRRDHRA